MVSHFQIRFCVNWLLMQVHEVPVQFRFTQTIRASNLRAKYKFFFGSNNRYRQKLPTYV